MKSKGISTLLANSSLEQEVEVLLWLKKLDEFEDGDFEGASFNTKYQGFEDVEAIGIKREDYDKCVDFWINRELLSFDNENGMNITESGKVVFANLKENGKLRKLGFWKEVDGAKDIPEIADIINKYAECLNLVINVINLSLQISNVIQ